MTAKSSANHRDQEEGRARRPPWVAREGGLRGLCDGDDVVVYCALADGSSSKVKQAVAGYFNDPKGTANLLGTTMAGNGEAVTTEPNDNLRS